MYSTDPAGILAVTQIHGIAGRRDELRALMRDTQERVVTEPGCRVYRFAAGVEDPDEYLHVQEWASEEAFAAHQRSHAFRDYQTALFELLARPSDMRIHRGGEVVVPQPSAPPDPRSAD
jgi:quinol monooxygenase YgiN